MYDLLIFNKKAQSTQRGKDSLKQITLRQLAIQCKTTDSDPYLTQQKVYLRINHIPKCKS